MAKEADDPEADETEGEKKKKKPFPKKKGLLLGGGMLGLIVAAYIVSMVAFPAKAVIPPFQGPFLADLSNGDVQVNLRGDARRFLVMTLRAEYEGYDQTYLTTRTADPVYQAKIQDEIIGLARQKTREEMEDQVGLELLLVEIHETVEPLIFPVHVGNPLSSTKGDKVSGLAPGESVDKSTMRGGFKAHLVHIDRLKDKVSLDEGPEVRIQGNETDLELTSENGLTVYVDVTAVPDDFVGDVNVGTFGRVLSILKGRFLIQ